MRAPFTFRRRGARSLDERCFRHAQPRTKTANYCCNSQRIEIVVLPPRSYRTLSALLTLPATPEVVEPLTLSAERRMAYSHSGSCIAHHLTNHSLCFVLFFFLLHFAKGIKVMPYSFSQQIIYAPQFSLGDNNITK